MVTMIAHFKQWLVKWDRDIVTQDDIETQQIVIEKIMKAFKCIEDLLHKSDQKAMSIASKNLVPGSNEALEKEVLAMFENQKKSWYKNLKNTSYDLTYIKSILENIYEIKNRRSRECFQLRAENAKLRAEINQLRKS
ncbi:hypothetical protein [Chryseobacterium sp. SG20098]|uniref:hypothetical protein n=1 Tax=Chryseobacterium sp. SG20098 TaxID=3074145 RepID=UPI002883172E|nr:hypothetical protein [Chryseobacterium sp. SG20098]WNI34674.1 hypothetical protein RHP76_11825 [Chryseobacterium sp. SG20098]